MSTKDALLVSSVGFSSGWIPTNIALLKSVLEVSGFDAETFFMSVEFTEKLRREFPHLLYIDKYIGELGYSFHEPFFAAKTFSHVEPVELLRKLVDLKRRNQDVYGIYEFAPAEKGRQITNNLQDETGRQHVRRLFDYAEVDDFDSYLSDIRTYCELLENFAKRRLIDFSGFRFKIIGFSCNFAQFFISYFMAKFVKQQWTPSPVVVFGGPVFETWNVDAYRMNFPEIDKIILGDGEHQLAEVLREVIFAQDAAKERLELSESTALTRTTCYPLLDVAEELPYPDYDSIQGLIANNENCTLLTWRSRNCSWAKCAFCADVHGPFWTRAPERVFDEIRYLNDKYGVTIFGFGEPDVNGDIRGFELLCDLLGDAKPPCEFWCELNARKSSRSLLRKMKRAGFKNFQIGIESFSAGLLRKMHKPSRLIDNLKVLKWANDAEIEGINYNLICNFPGETDSDLYEMIDMISSILPLLSRSFRVSIIEFELYT